MKHLILPLTACFTLIAQGAIAGQFEDRSVKCYFFQNETLAIKETCTSSGGSWAGGGGHSLKWSDGVVSIIKFGLHGRGTPVCPDRSQVSVDGVCGTQYFRSTKTLKRTSESSESTMHCVQLEKKSVCWNFQI
jgi:hypothetical protein